MYKKTWKDEEAVSPVIATILMVAITVVLAGVLVVYMQQFSNTTQNQAGTAIFVIDSTFADGSAVTTNGGGWVIKVQSVEKPQAKWMDVKVSLEKSGVPLASMNSVDATDADVSYTGGAPMWFAKQNVAPNYDEGGVSTLLSTAPANVGAGEFETIENAYFVIVDSDGDSKMTSGDIVFVYKDNDASGTNDITSEYQVSFRSGGDEIGVRTLT